jgi:hypothetical protein
VAFLGTPRSAALTVHHSRVDNDFVTRRQRWAVPGLLVLPLVLFAGCLVLLGPVLMGMAPVVAVVTSLGALVILAATVHHSTGSIALAALATTASIFISLAGLFWLMIWAVSGATFG